MAEKRVAATDRDERKSQKKRERDVNVDTWDEPFDTHERECFGRT